MAATAATGHIIHNIEDHHHHHHHRRSRSVSNLTKLIDVELDLLMESFQEAKRRIDPVIAQINQARYKFDQLLQQGGLGGEKMVELELERELRDLKQTTSKLKSKIPSNLIAPEYQPAADPSVIFQPRIHPRKPTSTNTPLLVVEDDASLLGDRSESMNYFSERLSKNPYALDSTILRCFLAFPVGAFIKARLLYSFTERDSLLFNSSESGSVVSTACELVSKGLIKSVYKRHSTATVDGFWMDPFVHHTLKDCLPREIQLRCLVNSIDGEDIIHSGSADPSILSSHLRFLHLGKWQRYSPTHHNNNIEMPDPNLYFKYAGDMLDLMYISFRGVSVMKELPGFITHLQDPNTYGPKLWCLSILDLKACHHLEVIPSNIGNLWRSLTHLDMSECYFLDHMPPSLSRLINLRVLKGFFVGETNHNEEETCTLEDLSSLADLTKLNIYTSLKTFPNVDHLAILAGFAFLRNLTICWGGCPTRDENRELRRPGRSPPAIPLKRLVTRSPVVQVNRKFSFVLQKLDLRGAPENGTPNWLRSSNFEKLEKLYIRGGKLSDLRHIKEAQIENHIAPVEEKYWWSVKILRLRHLSKLQLDWSELQNAFPNVVRVEKVECQNLTSFPCDDNGLWTKDSTPSATTSF